MNKLLIIFLIFALASCTPKSEFYQEKMDDAEIVEHEDCQYVLFEIGSRGFMSHKGSCKNIIHKQ